jgi:hypothetical protein
VTRTTFDPDEDAEGRRRVSRAWSVPMTEARWLFIRQAVLVPIRHLGYFYRSQGSSMGFDPIGVKLSRRYSTSALITSGGRFSDSRGLVVIPTSRPWHQPSV